MDTLTTEQISEAALEGWVDRGGSIATRLMTKDFATGVRLVVAIGAAAEEMNHHPDLDLRYPFLDVHLTSHDAGGVTDRDVRLARRVTELARAADVEQGAPDE